MFVYAQECFCHPCFCFVSSSCVPIIFLSRSNIFNTIEIFLFYRTYEAQSHSAAEVKQEVESHLQEKEILESVIPSNIVIGPFWVNTENVRQALSKKRKALSNAVLELLAKKLRQQADGVSLLYFTFTAITLSTSENVFGAKTWKLDGRVSEVVSPKVTNSKV